MITALYQVFPGDWSAAVLTENLTLENRLVALGAVVLLGFASHPAQQLLMQVGMVVFDQVITELDDKFNSIERHLPIIFFFTLWQLRIGYKIGMM